MFAASRAAVTERRAARVAAHVPAGGGAPGARARRAAAARPAVEGAGEGGRPPRRRARARGTRHQTWVRRGSFCSRQSIRTLFLTPIIFETSYGIGTGGTQHRLTSYVFVTFQFHHAFRSCEILVYIKYNLFRC